MVHVVSAPDGPVTPVGVEQAIEALDEVAMAAVVGVGPVGTQQVVAVVVPRREQAHRPAGSTGPRRGGAGGRRPGRR